MTYTSLTRACCAGLLALTFAHACSGDIGEPRETTTDDVSLDPLDSPNPHPAFVLTSFAGNLCTEEGFGFSPADSGFTIMFTGDQSGDRRCEIHIAMTVPAGYRFRKPIFSVLGLAEREDASVPIANVTMVYSMWDTSTPSQHPVWGPASDDVGESGFLLKDTPHLTTPECSDPPEDIELDLGIEITSHIPDRTWMFIDSILGEFEYGVEWTTCSHGFAEPLDMPSEPTP